MARERALDPTMEKPSDPAVEIGRLERESQYLASLKAEIEQLKKWNAESVHRFNLVSEENRTVRAENKSLKNDLEKVGNWSKECASKVTALESSAVSVSHMREDLAAANARIKEMEATLDSKSSVMEQCAALQAERDDYFQRMQDMDRAFVNLTEQHRLQQTVVLRLQSDLKSKEQSQAHASELIQQRDALANELAALKGSTVDAAQHSAFLRQKEQQCSQALAALAQAESDKTQLALIAEEKSAECARLVQQAAALQAAADALRADTVALRAALETRDAEAAHLRALLGEKRAETHHISQAVASLKRQRDELRAQLAGITAHPSPAAGSPASPLPGAAAAAAALRSLEDDPYASQTRALRLKLEASQAELAQAHSAITRLRARQTSVCVEQGVQTAP
jgi:chromosome segregation ATPase